jgi:F-type H+-transporting ATPase subunit b
MKKTNLFSIVYILSFVTVVILFFSVSPALAEEQSGSWRKTYDVIMMWVNFLILAGALYWLLKKPIGEFIQNQKEDTERELQKAEEQKNIAVEKIRESKAMLEEGKEKFALMKERIIAQGENAKEQIIQSAEEQSKFMINEAKRKTESMLLRAKSKLRNEIIDEAFDIALQKMPSEITDEDKQRCVEKFITSLAA